MVTKREYNGWINYETWLAKLWLDNDGYDFEPERYIEEADFDRDQAEINLASSLEELHEEFKPEVQGIFADLLNAAMSEIDWREIAENVLRDVTIYSAGWNMPGYLCDSEPQCFLDADDAMEYIKDAAKEAIEEESSEDAYDQRCEAIDKWKSDKNDEFGYTFGQYHYFVSVV